jgi:hypothetical protein
LDSKEANDSAPWSEMDIEDLKKLCSTGLVRRVGAHFLCRSATGGDVLKKAKEVGL